MKSKESSARIASQSKISKIICRFGMLDKVADKSSLKAHVLTGADIPSEVQTIFCTDKVAELAGQCGDPEWGTPIQYQQAVVTLADGQSVEFEVFNLAIMIFSTEDERVKRLFRFMVRLERSIKK